MKISPLVWKLSLFGKIQLSIHTLICIIASQLKHCWAELINYITNLYLYSLVVYSLCSWSIHTEQLVVGSHLLGWKSVRTWAAAGPVGTLKDRGSQMCHNFLSRSSFLVAIETCTYKARKDKVAQANLKSSGCLCMSVCVCVFVLGMHAYPLTW